MHSELSNVGGLQPPTLPGRRLSAASHVMHFRPFPFPSTQQENQGMNLVRFVISVFLAVLLALTVAGWVWAGKQPSPTLEGARIVLVLSGLSALGGLAVIWSAKPPMPAK